MRTQSSFEARKVGQESAQNFDFVSHSHTRTLKMGDALEDALDYEELSPAPKPARAAGGGKSGAATKQAEAVDAAEIYGDLFAPAAPAAPDATAGGGLPAPGSIAALEADEVRKGEK